MCRDVYLTLLPSISHIQSIMCRRDPALLNPLTLREDLKGSNGNGTETYVLGLSEFSVKSVEETFELLRTAERNRRTRETDMNSFSSRSHSVFQVGLVKLS